MSYMDKTNDFGIYVIRNRVNGLMYIGKTSRKFKIRWREHKRELNQGKKDNYWFQREWKLYGEENFEFLVLYTADELDDLDELEGYFVKKYNTYNLGYNDALPKTCSWDDMKKLSRGKFTNDKYYEINIVSWYRSGVLNIDKDLLSNLEKYRHMKIRIIEVDTKIKYETTVDKFLRYGLESHSEVKLQLEYFKVIKPEIEEFAV